MFQNLPSAAVLIGALRVKCTSVSENCFILASSADPDEMPLYVAFHQCYTVCQHTLLGAVQWLSGRVLDSRPKAAGSSLTDVTALCI